MSGAPLTSGYVDIATENECAGFILFGYWPTGLPEKGLPSIASISNCFNDMEMEMFSHDYPTALNVRSVEIRVSHWPDSGDWPEQLANALGMFLSAGAVLAWCGDETGSPSIDDFTPPLAHGNVYAALDETNGFSINSGLDDKLSRLSDKQLSLYSVS